MHPAFLEDGGGEIVGDPSALTLGLWVIEPAPFWDGLAGSRKHPPSPTGSCVSFPGGHRCVVWLQSAQMLVQRQNPKAVHSGVEMENWLYEAQGEDLEDGEVWLKPVCWGWDRAIGDPFLFRTRNSHGLRSGVELAQIPCRTLW